MTKSKTPSYVLTLPLKTTVSDHSALEKYFEFSRRIYNALLGESLKRLKLMRESKIYQKARKTNNKNLKKKLFKEAEINHGFREYDLSKYTTKLRVNEYKELGSHITQKLTKRAFNSVNKVRFGEAKKVNFIRFREMYSIEGADNKQGIKYRDGFMIFNKLKIPVTVKKNDVYAHLALQDRVKYCRIVRKNIKSKIKFYLQLVLEGIPPKKYNKETGEVKHIRNEGKVGIDIGTQTIAIVSEKEVRLLELASSIQNIEDKKRILQRKLDRQRRTNNPHKYNEDGTIARNNKKWTWSNNYIKTKNKLADLQRKQTDIRRQDHNKLANYILSLGDDIKVENMNYKALQARSKETTINEKTGKYNKKKRFGKSLANKAPAMLLMILDNKLKFEGKELKKIDTYYVKASQYNHFDDNYAKKSLSDRWNEFDCGKVQRDLYSAFLIMNVNEDLKTINREECFIRFDNFKELHDLEIERIKSDKSKLISSMGI